MARARNLNDHDVAGITSLLDGWADVLTWKALIDEVERRFYVRYTRQALHKHTRIAAAFRLRKEALRAHSDAPVPQIVSPELQSARERIARLEAENQRLEAENRRLLEQFLVWVYNANSRGISEEVLSRPLPSIDRGRSDGRAKP